MGRIAGVTPTETKERLLRTCADVFARLGYEGASISQITSEAGLSSGAIYAHYAGKAELFVAALRAHGEGEFERLLGGCGVTDFPSFLIERGNALGRSSPRRRSLLTEAIVAAKRDPDVARVLSAAVLEREKLLAGLLGAAQDSGEIDADLPAGAVVRFTLMLALGSMLVGALDLPPTDPDDWCALIARLVDNVRSSPAPADEP